MAGIKVPQYDIFKIGTNKLAYNNWNINIEKDDACLLNEMVSLFEGQYFRIISKILDKPTWKIDYSEYICSVVIEQMSHFNRVTSSRGIKINGKIFKRFVGTTGGLKNNCLLMVNAEIIDELNRRCECGRENIPLVPAKYEAYKALSCSASQPISWPEGILVVKDCFTKFTDSIIYLDNSDTSKDSPIQEYIENTTIENNTSDGFNLCTYEYMAQISSDLKLRGYVTNGVCLRNAWLKGMMYPFPIVEFFEKYHINEDGTVNYNVRDIWGQLHDIRNIQMILTESSLKLWSAYKSIDDYISKCKENGYQFAVTKISPHKLDDRRELNYQYIQSYDLSDEDIAELSNPTIEVLKDAMCGDYQKTLEFIGGSSEMEFTWQKALQLNPYMLKDPYIIDCVHRMIKKKIDQAKIGRLIVDGNYQIASGDPFLLMQSICGIEPTGLLKSGEVYSSYWNNKDVDEVVVFRSPMTCHNNIRRCKLINNEDTYYWYQYMDNIMIVNGWDTFCQAENGCDYDGDLLFSTNNSVLLKKYRQLPAVVCAQSNAAKVEINDEVVKKSNKNGMGNKVGTITNRVTGFIEVQSRFKKGSEEWKELEYRIQCGQLYQQDEIDKIKGIKARPMPNYWYSPKSCDDEFNKKIALDKKPYFMIYVYEDYKKKEKKSIKTFRQACNDEFNCNIEDLRLKEKLTEEEKEFLKWIDIESPFGNGPCSMNKLCWYVESQMNGYQIELKHASDFDYNVLKVKRRCTNEHRKMLEDLCDKYRKMIKSYKSQKTKKNPVYETIFIDNNREKAMDSRIIIQDYFYNKAKEICPNDDERLNIILDMCYQYRNNMQFCWDTIGDLICKRVEELNIEK